jgi:hypothetical protein
MLCIKGRKKEDRLFPLPIAQFQMLLGCRLCHQAHHYGHDGRKGYVYQYRVYHGSGACEDDIHS